MTVVPMRTCRPRRWLCAVLLGPLAPLALTPGCNECGGVPCGGCPAALELRVTDALTGESVVDVTVDGADALCELRQDLGYTACDVHLTVGAHELVVTAPGYEEQELGVTINPDSGDACCSCGYNAKRLEVELEPV